MLSSVLSATSKTSPDHHTKYWNRELRSKIQVNTERRVVRQAKIISLSDPDDKKSAALNLLPEGATLLAVGLSFDAFDIEALKVQQPNIIFASHRTDRNTLAKLLDTLPSIEWVHSRSAGVDYISSPTLSSSNVLVTNSRGQFSSILAEYTMTACSHFAKDIPRLMRQKEEKSWQKFGVKEIRGATMGIIGFGDIGRACAKLAKAYGMRIVALRRKPELSSDDPYCDVAYGTNRNDLNRLMSESDYILCSAPLTEDTKGFIGKEAFENAKDDAVFINVGRGPIVDEDALIDALKNGKLRGAALDVFTEEPLPVESNLWNVENVLLSPHNMFMRSALMFEATEFFVYENLERYIRGEELLNFVDQAAGY